MHLKVDTSLLKVPSIILQETPSVIGRAVAIELNNAGHRMHYDLINEVADVFPELSPQIIAAAIESREATEQFPVFAIVSRDTMVTYVTWVTQRDEKVCPICGPRDGVTFRIIDVMDIYPAHPNAVLAGSRVASYGAVHEGVSAVFVGPVVKIRVGSKITTIGPNHPMLTMRGMVKARDIKEGDQLLYDSRFDEDASVSGGANFKEVPFIEDSFEALRTFSIYKGVAAPQHDLHGDRVFCQGEVEVILPARQLLPVFDASLVKHLRKQLFTRTNAELALVAGCGAADQDRDVVMLAPAGRVGGTDPRVVAYPFRWLTVMGVGHGTFSGRAFDMSTASSLYCSDGFVVSNCRCTLDRLGITDAMLAAGARLMPEALQNVATGLLEEFGRLWARHQ